MPSFRVVVETPVFDSTRVQQVSGMFDVAAEEKLRRSWNVDLPLHDRPWSVGLIVGPSGSGKTQIAKSLFRDAYWPAWTWHSDRAVIDEFPASMSIVEIVQWLSGVGFSSPPHWLQPYYTLSNGEKFRVEIARALAESKDIAVIDEWTSVVDRQVAQVVSWTAQKAVRRAKKQIVAVGCHYDVIDWLQPEWIYEPINNHFYWRDDLQRPKIVLEIGPASRTLWEAFRPYHYLSGQLNGAAHCFAAQWDDKLVAFAATRHLPHLKAKNVQLGHRLVVLPDYQGLGIGLAIDNWLGSYWYQRGWRYHNTVAHPAMINAYLRSPRWRLINGTTTSVNRLQTKSTQLRKRRMVSATRPTYSFAYVPTKEDRDAFMAGRKIARNSGDGQVGTV